MKKGSTDDPFAEEPVADEESEQLDESDDQTDDNLVRSDGSDQSRVLPYIYKRDAVKEGRSQRPVYLREYNEERISELVADVEECLGEEMTKTDLLEAAMETAIENPELVADILRAERYGYDWE